jgi:threonine synthase
VSTAHWAKFGADVYKALHGLAYSAPLPGDAAALPGVELLAEVAAFAGASASVPAPLAELGALPERFTGVVDAGRDAIEAAIAEWLTR